MHDCYVMRSCGVCLIYGVVYARYSFTWFPKAFYNKPTHALKATKTEIVYQKMKIKRGMCQISNCRICYKMLQHQPCGKSMKKKDNTAIKIRTVYILRQTDKPQSSGPEPIGHQSSKLEDVLKVYMHLIPYIS